MNWCSHTLSDVNALLYIKTVVHPKQMQLSNNDNWKILYKYIRQSPFPEINPTDIDTYNILRFCFFPCTRLYSTLRQSPFWDCIYGSQALLSFNNIRFSLRVLIYMVHYGNRPSEITHTDLRHFSFNNIRFSFRVLIYIVHYGNRPSGIAYTDLRHFSHLTIYAFLSVYLSIWYTTAIALLRLHIRISGTSHLTIYAFLCVYLSISVLMWKTGRRLPRIVADGGSTAVHVSTKKN